MTSIGSLKKQESSRKTSTSALLTTLKPLTMWITTKNSFLVGALFSLLHEGVQGKSRPQMVILYKL